MERGQNRFSPMLKKTLVCVAASLLALVAGSRWNQENCHIHPPEVPFEDDRRAFEYKVYPTLEACEEANLRLHGGAGRCHCLPGSFIDPREIPFPKVPQNF
jgi:hypothetical protein